MASHTATRSSHAPSAEWKARGLETGFGCLTGLGLLLWSFQYLATFGTSIPVTSALVIAIGVAGWLGLRIRTTLSQPHIAAWITPGAWLAIAVWSVTFVWWLAAGRWGIGLLPMSVLSSEAATFCLMLGVALALFVPPLTASFCIADVLRTPSVGEHREVLAGRWVLGISVGLLVGPALLAPVAGLPAIMVLITAACGVGFWCSLNRADQVSVPVAATATDLHAPWIAGLSLLIGMELPLTSRFALQLMPGSPFEHYAVWGGLVAGVGIGMVWSSWSTRRRSRFSVADGPLIAAAIATIWPVAMLSIWGLLVDGVLAVNSSISSVPAIMVLRVLIAGGATAPLGVALGRLWSTPSAERSSVATALVCTSTGIVLASSTTFSPITSAAVLVTLAMVIGVARYWVLGPSILQSRRWQVASAAAVLSVALLPLVSGNYRPDVAAKLLFSTQTFSAMQSGISRELLPYLDDSRLVAVSNGRTSTWTVWKHRGSQLALRENGLPRGVLSSDPQTSPQFAGEVMPAVVPMVLHERPQSVVMLGIGSTASLSSVLACPVESVTCVENDVDLIAVVDDVLAEETGRNPLNDNRVQLWNAAPALALMSRDLRCDVLIINDAQPSIMSSTSGFTSEFYSAALAALHDDGLLCQRLQYADFGREPIEDLLATVQSVFHRVALFDAAPGEMLIIATQQAHPLVTEATIDRCATPHIRNLMAQVGWDWSVLMNLGAVSPEAVAELTSTRGTANSVRNGRFAFGLPQEVMRWSSPVLPKWKQRQQLLNAHASRMLAWIGESERQKDVQQRLADVIEQQRLISEHPDHYWAYRKTLKERLTERPRGVIQQVRHEGLKRSLHPEDQRRKNYLEVLGTAATSGNPDLHDIQELARFAVPYDPLVSYFLHQEAANLYRKSESDDPESRFQHLRYSIYFGPPNDQSVRNVVTALQLLNDHPELCTDAQSRWDELNSLLEVLKQRSTLRLQADQTASTFELVDAERSINIAKRTMATMDALRPDTRLTAEDWSHRRTVLERMLVRPMWKYHSQQAARLARQHAQAEAISASR